MNRKRFSMVFILLIFFCILLVSGCTQEKAITKNLTSDKYVLIHFINYTSGELIEGNFEPQLSFYDGPLILIDNNSKTIRGLRPINTSESFKGILVYTTADFTPIAQGAGSNYIVINQLPSAYEDVKIQNIDDDGTVTIVYNDSTIILKPGEQWFNSTTKIAQCP